MERTWKLRGDLHVRPAAIVNEALGLSLTVFV